MLKIKVFCERKDSLGEGPLWDVAEQALYVIDIVGKAVHRYDPSSGQRHW